MGRGRRRRARPSRRGGASRCGSGRRRPARAGAGPRCPRRSGPGRRCAPRRGSTAPAVAWSIIAGAASVFAAARSWCASSSAGMCSKLLRDVVRGEAPALGRGEQRLRVRRGGLGLLDQPRLKGEHLLVRVVLPTAGRGERHDRPRPPARGELERDVAAERVADEVRSLEARVVHRPLDGVGHRVARRSRPRSPARPRGRPASGPGRRAGARAQAARAPTSATCRGSHAGTPSVVLRRPGGTAWVCLSENSHPAA